MRLRDLKLAVKEIVTKTHHTPLIIGEKGIGKTEVMQQLFFELFAPDVPYSKGTLQRLQEEHKVPVQSLYLSMMPPEDIQGIPYRPYPDADFFSFGDMDLLPTIRNVDRRSARFRGCLEMSQNAMGQDGPVYLEDDEVNVLVWVDLGKWPIGLVLGPNELVDREALLQAVKENMIDMLNVVSPLDFGKYCAFQVEEDPDQAARPPDEEEMARLREMLGDHRSERLDETPSS